MIAPGVMLEWVIQLGDTDGINYPTPPEWDRTVR